MSAGAAARTAPRAGAATGAVIAAEPAERATEAESCGEEERL